MEWGVAVSQTSRSSVNPSVLRLVEDDTAALRDRGIAPRF
jgi:hypothetical protein